MIQSKNLINLIVLSLFFIIFSSCGGGSSSSSKNIVSKRAGVNEVYIHLSSDLDKLNPIISTSANASLVERFLFQSLIDRDPSSLDLVPSVAVNRPTIEETTVEAYGESFEGLKFSYTIKDDAVWDDGKPITADDYEFVIKCIKNPKVDCESLRPYFEFIVKLEKDPNNSKSFVMYTKDRYILSESVSAGYLYPKHIYDPNGIMDKYSVEELSNPSNLAKISGDKNIIEFANQFNAEKYSRDPEFVIGSGPYKLKEWTTGQRIILEKKDDWWGEKYSEQTVFNNFPDKLIYEIIVDNTTAVTAMKDEGVDIMNFIPSKDFIELKENKEFLKLYNTHQPIAPAYSYIGLNNKSPKLNDKMVRQALSMALDYETIKRVVYYDLAQRATSPVHPNKSYANKDIVPYPFDLNRAKEYLENAGWEDKNGDGVREKTIDGNLVEMKLNFLVPAGSEAGENIALMLKNNLSKLGVQIEIVQKEWTVFLEQVKAHDFELCTMSWMMGADLDDFKQIWHTESYNGGSNYVGFGNAYTDQLIDRIRYENDVTERDKLYKEFQQIIHDEAPYIFLFTPLNKMAFHKRFDNANPYLLRPGFFENEFKLNPNFGKASSVQ